MGFLALSRPGGSEMPTSRSWKEQKVKYIAATYVALGFPQEEAMRRALSVIKGRKKLRLRSTRAKNAAATRVIWPVNW
jgi:hypothetical protein